MGVAINYQFMCFEQYPKVEFITKLTILMEGNLFIVHCDIWCVGSVSLIFNACILHGWLLFIYADV